MIFAGLTKAKYTHTFHRHPETNRQTPLRSSNRLSPPDSKSKDVSRRGARKQVERNTHGTGNKYNTERSNEDGLASSPHKKNYTGPLIRNSFTRTRASDDHKTGAS